LADLVAEERERSFPELSVGWYREEYLYSWLQPTGRWHTAPYRPFMVIRDTGEWVYLILFSRSPLILYPDPFPEVDLSRCVHDFDPRCESLKGRSRVFRVREGEGYRTVFRIRKVYLLEGADLCGICCEKDLPEGLLRSLKREVEGWRERG